MLRFVFSFFPLFFFVSIDEKNFDFTFLYETKALLVDSIPFGFILLTFILIEYIFYIHNKKMLDIFGTTSELARHSQTLAHHRHNHHHPTDICVPLLRFITAHFLLFANLFGCLFKIQRKKWIFFTSALLASSYTTAYTQQCHHHRRHAHILSAVFLTFTFCC